MSQKFVTNVKREKRSATPSIRPLEAPVMNWGEEPPVTVRPTANVYSPYRPQDATENERNRPVSALPAPAWNFGTR